MGIGAGISALGSLGAGLFSSNAASKAAQTQAQATQWAQEFQQNVYQATQNQLSPYISGGTNALNSLTSQLPQLTSQFSPTESSLESTPGYQFDLSQGLKSTQNSAAARGLGVSGAALKGASTYATGLADNTLQTQFNIDQTNKTNAYNKLIGTAQLGSSAAAAGGSLGQQAATNFGNITQQGATAQAAAQTAAGTAFNPLLNNLGSYYSTANNGSALANRLNVGSGSLTSGLTNGLSSLFSTGF